MLVATNFASFSMANYAIGLLGTLAMAAYLVAFVLGPDGDFSPLNLIIGIFVVPSLVSGLAYAIYRLATGDTTDSSVPLPALLGAGAFVLAAFGALIYLLFRIRAD